MIGGAGSKKVLIRAVGPGLANFGVPGILTDPILTVFDSTGSAILTNDNWNTPDGTTFASVGAFPLPAGSKDSAIVATLSPGAYTAQIRGIGGTGIALLEIYDAGAGGQLINLSARFQIGAGASAGAAGFVIGPGTGTRKLLVRGIGPALSSFGLGGFLPDPKLVLMDGNSRVLASAAANGNDPVLSNAYVQAGAFAATANDSAVIATVGPGLYTAQVSSNSGPASGIGMVEVYDITGSIGTPPANGEKVVSYLAKLLPAAAASGSSASGYATLLFDPNTNTATVNVRFSGLSSPEAIGHLEIGTPTNATYLLTLAQGQVDSQTWTIAASGPYAAADLIQALQNGQIFVEIDSARFPGGELLGSFIQSTGTQLFSPPPAAPALPAGAFDSPAPTDAARLLTQSSFGPRTADVQSVVSRGIGWWLDDQMALPPSFHLPETRADAAAFPAPSAGLPSDQAYIAVNEANRQEAWWKIAVTAPDQLRQRIAFALSEIFVVSEQTTSLRPQAEALAKYYDLLVNDAFGNFRQLLEDVTRSPVMGVYLSYLRNRKGDPANGTSPDENYAREVQQLFTIGLVQLQPDGSLILDSAGQPIPTYNQGTITETAKVLTGWAFANVAGFSSDPPDTRPQGAADDSGWLNPMAYFDSWHDSSQKSIASVQQVPLSAAAPTVVPAGGTGPQDLKILLDTLFNHPNAGPFFCRQLIQRLVTSNPSPGYVYRVAQVFADDGTGTRGNLRAVVRSILTDYEARSPDAASGVGYGKIKEPLLRMTAFFRALGAKAANGRFLDSYFGDPRSGYSPGSLLALPEFFLGEGVLQSPTVFNFFSPDYVAPGPLAAAGLVAPEMEITDSTFAMNLPNEVTYYLYRDVAALPAPPSGASPFLVMDYSGFLPLASDPAALLDRLNLLFCSNSLSAATQANILGTLQSLSPNTSDIERVETAIHLIVTSPDAARQK